MSDLVMDVIMVAGGMIVAWWFLPQPKWVARIYNKLFGMEPR